MLPQTDPWGNQFGVEREIKPVYLPLPDLQTAPIGVRLRFLRKRRGLTIPDLEQLTRISHGSISRLETGSAPVNIAAVGKILAFFGPNLAEVFPDGQDPRDLLAPVSNFSSWLRNFRMRKGLQQVELARILRVSKVTVCRYERNRSRPQEVILKRLKKAFNLDGDFSPGRHGASPPSMNRMRASYLGACSRGWPRYSSAPKRPSLLKAPQSMKCTKSPPPASAQSLR